MSKLRKPTLLVLVLCSAFLNSLLFYPQIATANQIHIVNGKIVDSPLLSPDADYKTIEYIDGAARLNDHANGYCISYPADMYLDASLSQVVNSLNNYDTTIEIYYDDFADNSNTRNVADYIYYSNLFMRNSTDHYKTMEKNMVINGLNAHILGWQRAKLNRVPHDKNNYLSAEIAKNYHEVYTILIKSTHDVMQFMPIIESFQIIPRQGRANINTRFIKTQHYYQTRETQDFYTRFFSDSAPLTWGIYDFSINNGYEHLSNLEGALGGSFDFILWYKSISTPFPADILIDAYQRGKYVELTLHTELADQSNKSIMYAILNGDYDNYFSRYALELKAFGRPVLFRLNNEMNGDWCNWSSFHFSKDTEIFKQVWRHVFQIFHTCQADNVLWVWNPNDKSFPDFKWNHPLMYFPGAEYVDIIGLTGYNTGSYYSYEPWREFTEIYDPLYADYTRWFYFPLMITEFACNSVGGDKARWISDMQKGFARYPDIKVAVWFNGIDYDADQTPARIYRLDETLQTMAAFSRVFNSTLSSMELVRP